jgi:hypothetical protein
VHGDDIATGALEEEETTEVGDGNLNVLRRGRAVISRGSALSRLRCADRAYSGKQTGAQEAAPRTPALS